MASGGADDARALAGYDRLIKLWDASRGLVTHRCSPAAFGGCCVGGPAVQAAMLVAAEAV
jgi:hypothetical protein